MRIGRREFGRRRVYDDGMAPAPRWGGGVRDYDGPVRRRGGGLAGLIPLLLVIWLIIGAIAAVQRGYFSGSDANCATASTTIVTIIAGPLNYAGVNPKVDDCQVDLPQPSQ